MSSTTFTARRRRAAFAVAASFALPAVAFAPQAAATPSPSAAVLGQVLTPVPAWPTCFGRQVTAIVPPGGADFNGSSDPAVVDVILGTSGEDRIFGLEGNDFICGGGAYDYIEAGPGSDWVDGEQDTDIIYGGTGADVLYGGAGGDLLLGDEGSDILFGQREDDSLACDPNPAVATGGTSDVADGGLGANDTIMVGDVGCESMTGVEYP